MAININRFNPCTAEPGHDGTILVSRVLPETTPSPFDHAFGYLERNGAMAGHAHMTDEIYIVLSGSGYVILGGKNRAVKAGDVIAIPAGCWHTMLCTDGDDSPFLWAAFWWDRMNDADVDGEIHVRRFDKEKAHPAHDGTILADDVTPTEIVPPFGHAYGYLDNGNSMESHAHPTWEVYIVYSGNGYVTIGEERQEVGAGDVIEIPPDETHSMTAQDNGLFLWAAFWWEK